MSQLTKLKSLLGNPQESNIDDTLTFYLDNANDIICDLRNSDVLESKYLTLQIKMAIEMYSKRGAEGQVGHSENGIVRSYESSDISKSLLSQITPMSTTPFSATRVVE